MSAPLPKPWNDVDWERSARLQAWGVPVFVPPALMGLPRGDSRVLDWGLFHQWMKDEKRILGEANGPGEAEDFGYEQQDDPSQAEAFHRVGSSTEVPYRSIGTPYRILENSFGPLGVTHVSGGLEDFGPIQQGSLPREERPWRAGNSRKRPRETEEDESEEIHGLGGYDNFGDRKPSKSIRGEGSISVGSDMEKLYTSIKNETEEDTSEEIHGQGGYDDFEDMKLNIHALKEMLGGIDNTMKMLDAMINKRPEMD
ncbi:hypothetical protein FBULB1_7638 [Fusarium bulbicola]|nr:hypothetical protein FBULB1_7638 [Fusarium bulbicola]